MPWWEVPEYLLVHFIRQLPSIQSEEELQSMEATWLATPSHSDDEIREKNRKVREHMELIMGESKKPKLSQNQHQVYLASMGIGYEVIEGEVVK